ncbi:MAG: radical SAM protein [Candidatus Eisenbacteria bacterium]|nr:radical SAM protein [Candidatus Eisenbacteria bacterium]
MASSEAVEALRVVLTARCNLRCAYCYQTARRPGRMSWRTLRTVVDVLCSSSAAEVELAFLGGEPLLEFELLRRAVLRAKERFGEGRRVRASVQTNGTLITERIAEFLAAEDVETQLSFDGVRRAQRGRQPGTFDVLDRLLDRLRKRRPDFLRDRVAVSLTLTPTNVRDLAASLAYFADKDARRVVVTPLITPAPEWRLRDIEELDRQFALIAEDARRRRQPGRGSPLALAAGPRRGAADRMMCDIRTDGLAVDVDGAVVACGAFAASCQRPATPLMKAAVAAARIGRLGDGDLGRRRLEAARALEGLGAFTRRERKRSGYRACAACPHIERCAVCPAAIAHGGDDPDLVPDLWCAWNQVSLGHPEAFAATTARERIRGARHDPARAGWRHLAATAAVVYNGPTPSEEVQPSRQSAHEERPPER